MTRIPQAAPDARRSWRDPPVATQATVTDVQDATFQAEVVDRSHEAPVVVDFWAPWCGPCRELSPLLEGLAEEFAGRVHVVKVNVDENPAVASQLQVQSIPAVFAFRDGAVAGQFLGAQPEPQVRAFITSLLPGEADQEATAGVAAREAGDRTAARAHFESALELDARHQCAGVNLAAMQIEDGALDQAQELLIRWPQDTEAKQLTAIIQFRRASPGDDRAELEERIAADAGDAAAHYALGNLLAARGEWDGALDHLLTTVQLDRALDDDGARLRMLDVFIVLGDRHELTEQYRRRLAGAIF